MTWGLVLAGGGVTGLAWEAGVVLGLRDAGVDVTTADVVLGTSAGSIVGSLVFGGMSSAGVTDLVADRDRPPLVLAGKPTDGDPARNLQVFTTWMSAGAMTAAKAAEIGTLAAGARTLTEAAWVGAFDESLGSLSWSPKLRIVTVSVESGERRVFTVGDGVALPRAVASSCAVPGTFPAVSIDGGTYLDGGLWSPISADLLVGDSLAAAVVVSPLGGTDPIGKAFTASVDREIEQLGAAGTAVELLTPATPISPLAAFDESKRVPHFEIGRADGYAAAERVAKAIRAAG